MRVQHGTQGWSAEYGILDGWHATHFATGAASDSRLVTPKFSLADQESAWLHFQQYVGNSVNRQHHYVEVSVDNGNTFHVLWQDLSPDGKSGQSIDLNPWIGHENVRIAFRYVGTAASIWSIDRVLVWEDSQPPPLIRRSVYQPNTGKVYHLLEWSNWIRAEKTAQLLGGHLASVNSADENDWIRTTFPTGEASTLWIGYTDAQEEGTWQWTDGAQSGYTNWDSGQPDDSSGQDFCSMRNSGRWRDYGPSSGANGVVEWDPSTPTLFASKAIAGGTATLAMSGTNPLSPVYIAYSFFGPGPTVSPWGELNLSTPILAFPPMLSGFHGQVALYIPIPPESLGKKLWFQGLELQTGILTNPVAIQVEP